MQNENPFFRRFTTNRNHSNRWRRWLGATVGLIALAFLVYNIPYVHDRLAWRVDELKTQIIYIFRPPQQAVFVPQENQAAVSSATAAALTPIPTRTPLAASQTPLAIEDPIPPSTQLTGFKYVDQTGGWNLCGPTSLAVALSYWGWQGTKYDVTDYVKPGVEDPNLDWVARGRPDKNVMPYELEDFVNSQVPGLQALYRVGGDIERIKRLIAAGFPVIVEKGSYCNPGPNWCGHYIFVTGYDDAKQEFTVQDVYLRIGATLEGRNVSNVSPSELLSKYWDEDGNGEDVKESYADFNAQWRAFDYLFFVIYPQDREAEVLSLLGPYVDEEWANRHALEVAQAETETLSGDALFYAWFNVGTSQVRLFEYVDAAFAYDYAFQLYADLPQDENQPFRMMWYQTGPYWAYYYSGRYNDVINLATTTLNTVQDGPTLEESLYWRALASWALYGATEDASADLLESVRINPHFCPGWQQITALGIPAPSLPWEGCSG